MFSTSVIFIVLLFVTSFIEELQAACVTWVSINPANYSTTFVLPTASNANTIRPLGFWADKAYFSSAEPQPCVTVSDASGNGRHFELLIEPVQSTGNICIRNKNSNNPRTCYPAQNTVTSCGMISSNAIDYEFTCSNCDNSQVIFWYRIVVEEAVNGNYDEYWCDSRNAKFPKSLKRITGNPIAPTPIVVDNPGGGSHDLFSFTKVIILSAVSYILHFLLLD